MATNNFGKLIKILMHKTESGIINTIGEHSNVWVILSLLTFGLIFAIFSVPYVGLFFNIIGAAMIWASFVLMAHRSRQ